MDQIQALARKHARALRTLAKIRSTLEAEFDGLNDAILALVLSVASGEPLLLIGPPGTAKSKLIRRFCTLVAIDTAFKEDDPNLKRDYFEYLLTPFTEPTELWGAYDPAHLIKGRLERVGENLMMQSARVVFLDEVFKGSSAILNSLLPFMNERVFFDRGQRRHVRLECLFAATNELPDSAELQAVADRFALRCRVDNAEPDVPSLSALLHKAWPLTYGGAPNGSSHPSLLDDLRAFRASITSEPSIFQGNERVTAQLAQLVRTARDNGLSRMSNRRLVKCLHVMLIHLIFTVASASDGAVPDAPRGLRTEELQLLPKYFLDDDTNEMAVAQMEAALSD